MNITGAKNIALWLLSEIYRKNMAISLQKRFQADRAGPILKVLKIAKGFIVILAIEINPTLTFSD